VVTEPLVDADVCDDRRDFSEVHFDRHVICPSHLSTVGERWVCCVNHIGPAAAFFHTLNLSLANVIRRRSPEAILRLDHTLAFHATKVPSFEVALLVFGPHNLFAWSNSCSVALNGTTLMPIDLLACMVCILWSIDALAYAMIIEHVAPMLFE